MRIDLREFARGQPCLVRFPGVCNHDRATTVGAHLRKHTGGGRKPTDLAIVHACSSCHDVIDGRAKLPLNISEAEYYECVLAGLLRTLSSVSAKLNELGVSLGTTSH